MFQPPAAVNIENEILQVLRNVVDHAVEHGTRLNVLPASESAGDVVELPDPVYTHWRERKKIWRYSVVVFRGLCCGLLLLLLVRAFGWSRIDRYGKPLYGAARLASFFMVMGGDTSLEVGVLVSAALLIGVTIGLSSLRAFRDKIGVEDCHSTVREYVQRVAPGAVYTGALYRVRPNLAWTDRLVSIGRDFCGMGRRQGTSYRAYDGSFRELQFHGHGRLEMPQGRRIEGDFLFGLPDGQVEIRNPLGDLVFAGELRIEYIPGAPVHFHGHGLFWLHGVQFTQDAVHIMP